jgi:HAE1 family hydrophobic/amphiphilic exporter-1
MTRLTSTLGLIPMAISTGEGAEIRAPLAITVMGGLASDTILILFMMPIVYYLFAGRDKTP